MDLKHPAVFLVGAGATRGALSHCAIPPPIDNDFFDIAAQIRRHGTPNLAKSVLEDVWALYGRTSGIGLETYYRDIESREKVGTFAQSKHRPKDWQKRKDDLNELIRRVMIQTTCDTSASPHTPLTSDLHEQLLHSVVPKDTIVTFNYDTLIEESFKSAEVWSPRGGYGKDVHGHELDWARKWFKERSPNNHKNSKIHLLKLHGSLNWVLYPNRQVRIKKRPYVVRTRNGRPVRDKVSILPPGWNKQVDKNPYKTLWRETRLRLERCKTLVIIGYSLPETDLLARALIAEVVRSRTARKDLLLQLHLADPNSFVTNRFVDLFAPALGAKGLVFKYSGFAELVKKLQEDTK